MSSLLFFRTCSHTFCAHHHTRATIARLDHRSPSRLSFCHFGSCHPWSSWSFFRHPNPSFLPISLSPACLLPLYFFPSHIVALLPCIFPKLCVFVRGGKELTTATLRPYLVPSTLSGFSFLSPPFPLSPSSFPLIASFHQFCIVPLTSLCFLFYQIHIDAVRQHQTHRHHARSPRTMIDSPPCQLSG